MARKLRTSEQNSLIVSDEDTDEEGDTEPSWLLSKVLRARDVYYKFPVEEGARFVGRLRPHNAQDPIEFVCEIKKKSKRSDNDPAPIQDYLVRTGTSPTQKNVKSKRPVQLELKLSKEVLEPIGRCLTLTANHEKDEVTWWKLLCGKVAKGRLHGEFTPEKIGDPLPAGEFDLNLELPPTGTKAWATWRWFIRGGWECPAIWPRWHKEDHQLDKWHNMFENNMAQLQNIMNIASLILGFMATGTLLAVSFTGEDTFDHGNICEFLVTSLMCAVPSIMSMLLSLNIMTRAMRAGICGGPRAGLQRLWNSLLVVSLAEFAIYVSGILLMTSVTKYVSMTFHGPDICVGGPMMYWGDVEGKDEGLVQTPSFLSTSTLRPGPGRLLSLEAVMDTFLWKYDLNIRGSDLWRRGWYPRWLTGEGEWRTASFCGDLGGDVFDAALNFCRTERGDPPVRDVQIERNGEADEGSKEENSKMYKAAKDIRRFVSTDEDCAYENRTNYFLGNFTDESEEELCNFVDWYNASVIKVNGGRQGQRLKGHMNGENGEIAPGYWFGYEEMFMPYYSEDATSALERLEMRGTEKTVFTRVRDVCSYLMSLAFSPPSNNYDDFRHNKFLEIRRGAAEALCHKGKAGEIKDRLCKTGQDVQCAAANRALRKADSCTDGVIEDLAKCNKVCSKDLHHWFSLHKMVYLGMAILQLFFFIEAVRRVLDWIAMALATWYDYPESPTTDPSEKTPPEVTPPPE